MNVATLKNKIPGRIAVLVSVAVLATLARAQAATPPEPPRHLTGFLNDYSPAHVNGVPVSGGPYEMRGRWSLEVQPHQHTGIFSAALNMETTDAGSVDQDDPTSRGAHTHHITMSGAYSTDTTGCPANVPSNPSVTWHYTVTGQAQITGNGNVAPFQKKLGTSRLQVCVGGGLDGTLDYSNVALLLGAPANTHFGPQPIHGVVIKCAYANEQDSNECTLVW